MKLEPISLNLQINKPELSQKPHINFTQQLANELVNTNNQLLQADNALQQLASGQTTSLHATMLTLEEAKLSFQYLEQIRNRLMNAYQELLREQI